MALITQQTGQFSGYTLENLRSLVLRMLRVTNTARYSIDADTDDYDWIDDALNRGQEDFVRRTKCLRSVAIVELAEGYRTYRLPWNFIDFMAAYYYDSTLSTGYRELIVTTVEELNDEVSNWRTLQGDPERIYIDRIYGNNWMFGLYKIPDANGDSITLDNYGSVVQWVCPQLTFNSEYGVIIRMTDTDEFIINTDTGLVSQIASMENNVLFEYYRLPEKLVYVEDELGNQGVQYPEIPREYHRAIAYFATSDLLQNNPEDSVEYKRAMGFEARFNNEIKTYIGTRKKPVSGHNLRARPAVWTWMDGMEWYKSLP